MTRRTRWSDNGFVRLHTLAGERGKQLARNVDLRRVDAGRVRQPIGASVEGHHHFLERRVTGALADAVDGALDLANSSVHGGQRIGDRKAQIVMAVRAVDDVVWRADFRTDCAEKMGNLVGRRIPHNSGQV